MFIYPLLLVLSYKLYALLKPCQKLHPDDTTYVSLYTIKNIGSSYAETVTVYIRRESDKPGGRTERNKMHT